MKKLKTLFVTIYSPLRKNTGGHQRTNLIYEFLKKNTDLDVLFLNVSHDKINNLEKDIYSYNINIQPSLSERLFSNIFFLSKYFITPRHKECTKLYKDITDKNKYDLIYFRFMATAIKCGVKDFSNVIIDVDDAPWQVHKSYSKSPSLSWYKRLYCRLRLPLIEYNSKKLLRSCKYYFTANPDDVFSKNGINLPNIPVNINTEKKEQRINKNVLFVGLMKFYPNYEGMNHFIDNIWSQIIQKHPDANLYIAGAGTPISLSDNWQKVKNIHILGYVEDLNEIYSLCSTVIAPIYSGAGTNIKVLEALAMKKICVASKFALKGFDKNLKNEEDILVANNDNDFIEYLDKVLMNPQKYSHLAENGHEKILRFYSRQKIEEIMSQTIPL